VSRLAVVVAHVKGWVLDPEGLAERILSDLDAYDLAHRAPAPARRTDPATSAKGAQDVAVRAGSQRHALLTAYAVGGPLLDVEAAQRADVPDRACWWRRCSDLRAAGFIEQVGERRDPRTGSMAMTCRITDKGRSALRGAR
jgi:hypothetical protein